MKSALYFGCAAILAVMTLLALQNEAAMGSCTASADTCEFYVR